MKRLMLAVLLMTPCLVLSADPAFEAGASFGKGNASAGTGSLKNPDAVTGSIPGYSAKPPESDYYGGVQGGDGGLSDKGQAALAGNDAAQSVISSGNSNPVPTIDPNAPFITIGKNAEAGSEGVLDGTNKQCTEVTVSKSTFENFQCDKDIASVEACTRTATAGGHTNTTTVQKTLTLNAADAVISWDGSSTSFSFAFVSTETGPIINAHFYWKAHEVKAGRINFWGLNEKMIGKAFDWAVPAAAGYHMTKNSPLPAAVYQSTSCVSGDKDGCRKHLREVMAGFKNGKYSVTLVITMNAVTQTFVPEVTWKTSCGLDMSKARKTTSTCTTPGGNKTVVNNGQSYQVHSDCWQYTDNYVVPSNSPGNCGTLTTDPKCTVSASRCVESTDGQCTHMSYTWQCQKTYQSGGLVCGGDYICKTGDCDEANGAGSSGFDVAVAKLAGLASAADDVKGDPDKIDIKAFTGKAMSCRKAFAGFSNCCKDSGWGQDTGLAACNSNEMAIGKAKAKKVTVIVGERCDRKVLGACIQKSQVYCVFDGKLARIIQEQGRRDQLGVKFGSGDSPNCRGITIPELQSIDFDKINFSDFYEDLMKNQKIPDTSAQVKLIKERIAAQVNQQGGNK